MEAQDYAVITVLLTVLGWALRNMYVSMKKRVEELERNDRKQDLTIERINTDIGYIRDTVETTSGDVKKILTQVNGKRASG